jgi:hypothetical protein
MSPLWRSAPAALGVAAVLLAGATFPLTAQSSADAPRVSGIRIERGDIFTRAEANRSFFARLLNNIHTITNHRVIRNEILLKEGEPWDPVLAAETERNLRGLGVFRSVSVDSVRTAAGLVARIRTRDGWSTSADLSYRSSGGDKSWGASVYERNLLGTVTRVGIGYRDTPDRTSWFADFSQPRLLAGRVGLAAIWHERSDGRVVATSLGQPFFSLASPQAWTVLGENRDERIYQYFEGESTARDTLERRFALGRMDFGMALRASKFGYTRAGIFAQLRRDDYAAFAAADTLGRSVSGAVGGIVEWRHARYIETRGFEGAGLDEDMDLSPVARAGLALTPEAFGYSESGVVPSVAGRIGGTAGPASGWAEVLAHGRFTAHGLDSGRIRVALTGFTPIGSNQSFVIHAEGGWLEDPAPGTEFDLGFATGPRSFGIHAFSGDRAVYATAEYRWFPIRDLVGLVNLGFAGFADYGGAWYQGSTRRTGWDAGLGLRVSASRSSDSRAIRVDLGRRGGDAEREDGWILSIGTGLTFSARLF